MIRNLPLWMVWREEIKHRVDDRVQPTGAHGAYNTGDKVSYNGKRYVCTADANVYAPDVYGWEVTT